MIRSVILWTGVIILAVAVITIGDSTVRAFTRGGVLGVLNFYSPLHWYNYTYFVGGLLPGLLLVSIARGARRDGSGPLSKLLNAPITPGRALLVVIIGVFVLPFTVYALISTSIFLSMLLLIPAFILWLVVKAVK